MKKILIIATSLFLFSCSKYKTYDVTITNHSGRPITVKCSEFDDIKINNQDYQIVVLNKGSYSINVTSLDNKTNYNDIIEVNSNTEYFTK